MHDLTNCEVLTNTFGGSEKKKRLVFDGRIYMVKFPDRVREQKNELSYMNNQFSEDIGCKIYKTLGFETQNTFLATYRIGAESKIVVACEDFTQDGDRLIEFHKLSLEHIENDSLRTQANIDKVMEVIEAAKQITDKADFTRKFWDMFVVDGFIGNRDRNLDNWGALEDSEKNLRFAPIYDCGSSLSPLITEDAMRSALNNMNIFKREEFNVYSCYRINRNKILFSEFMKTPPDELREAILRVVPKIMASKKKIEKIIDETPVMSDIHKRYLKTSLSLRSQAILIPALHKARGSQDKNNIHAR